MRSAFPWRRSPGFDLRKRELRVNIRRALNVIFPAHGRTIVHL
jgi:hypothetical protein